MKSGNPYWRGGSVQLTSLYYLVLNIQFSYWNHIFLFFTKQTILIRRLNVLSLPPQQEFPDEIIELSHVYSTITGKLNVDRLAYTVPNNFKLSRTNGSLHETSLGVRNFFLKAQSFAQYNPFKFMLIFSIESRSSRRSLRVDQVSML